MSMFRKKDQKPVSNAMPIPTERVTSVLGTGTIWTGSLSGSGGVRIEGAFDGEIALRGMLVIGATGRVTCPHLRANTIIIAGAVRGDITAERVEIRSSGRVWGDVVTAAFSTEDGAFLRGQIRMEERVDIGVPAQEKATTSTPTELEGLSVSEQIAEQGLGFAPDHTQETQILGDRAEMGKTQNSTAMQSLLKEEEPPVSTEET